MRSRTLARTGEGLALVQAGAPPLVDHLFAIHDHVTGAAAAGEHRLMQSIRRRESFRGVRVGHHEVRTFSDFEAAGYRAQAGRAGRIDGEYLQDCLRRKQLARVRGDQVREQGLVAERGAPPACRARADPSAPRHRTQSAKSSLRSTSSSV